MVVTASEELTACSLAPETERATEWLMLTSGTSGLPKIVGHTLEGLSGAIAADASGPRHRGRSGRHSTISAVMAVCRFSCARSSAADRWCCPSPAKPSPITSSRFNEKAVTHISGTPSHWRKLLMSGAASAFSPTLCPSLRRNRRPGGPRRICVRLSLTLRSVMPMHRPKPASALPSMTGVRVFRPICIGIEPRRRRNEGCGRLPSDSLAARRACLCRPSSRRADGRGRFRRHRRHGRTARRPLSLRRPPRRHHQYRRLEGSPRGNRSGDQPR